MPSKAPINPSPARWPDVILVNGPSSAGKSTLCRALQAAVMEPYLCIGFDDFIFTSPPRYYRGADTAEQADQDAFTTAGVRMVVTSSPGEPRRVVAEFGPVFRRLIDGMAPAVRAIVDAGNRVVFDHVLHDQAMYDSMRTAFRGLNVFSVGVICPLEVLEAREAARGDRVIGRARGLVEVVHGFCAYDVTIDTGKDDPQACLAQVLKALADHATHTA